MNLSDVFLESIPASSEEAFIHFEQYARAEYEANIDADRSSNYDYDNQYIGSYEPEKIYVTAMIAFLDEYEIDNSIVDISELNGDEFYRNFATFKSKMIYLSTRFQLRRNRISSGNLGTVITYASTFKVEIGKLLETIRKIVNQEITEITKRDKIFSKIASLQSEIDRDQTTIDAIFGRIIELSEVIGQSAKNIEPLIDKLERLKKIILDNPKKAKKLIENKRPKQITQQKEEDEFDEDIPF